jgi:molybdopterin molybdotransferase
MDGFAFDSKCLDTSNPSVSLQIVGTTFAGKSYDGTIGSDECLKIMTGAGLLYVHQI